MLQFVFQLSAILKIAAIMAAILKNKVDEDAPLISKILNTKKRRWNPLSSNKPSFLPLSHFYNFNNFKSF